MISHLHVPEAKDTSVNSPCSGVGFWWCRSRASWCWRCPCGSSRSDRPAQPEERPSAPQQDEPGNRRRPSSRPLPRACTGTERLFLVGSSCCLQTTREQNTSGTVSPRYRSPSRSKEKDARPKNASHTANSNVTASVIQAQPGKQAASGVNEPLALHALSHEDKHTARSQQSLISLNKKIEEVIFKKWHRGGE